MATPEDDFIEALNDLSALTQEAQINWPESTDLSESALGHRDVWMTVFLEREHPLSLSDVGEFTALVEDARRHAILSQEDFDDAVINALQTSLRMFQGLPGTTTIDPPMPKPRRPKVRERAFTQ